MNREELIAKWGEPQKVLDHGHVRLIDVMGNDSRVVASARVSYGKGLSQHDWDGANCKVCGMEIGEHGDEQPHCLEGDRRLIRYLVSNRHTSPIEQCLMTIHAKMPIFVARQWVRHRTARLNEVSARYTELDGDYYVPELDRITEQSKSNKQGSSLRVMDDPEAFQRGFDVEARENINNYKDRIHCGMARELARANMPVSTYTEWYWNLDLHNILHFLGLRLHPHAQYEVRVYAEVIWKIVQDWVPMVAEAFRDYRLEAVAFSRMEMEFLREVLSTGGVTTGTNPWTMADWRSQMSDTQLSKRERGAFLRKIGVIE